VERVLKTDFFQSLSSLKDVAAHPGRFMAEGHEKQ